MVNKLKINKGKIVIFKYLFSFNDEKNNKEYDIDKINNLHKQNSKPTMLLTSL